MLLAGIELIPEYQTGVGNLDFIFIGKIKNNGLSKICVEFKNAHSVDLVHGLEHQLPDYMRNTGSNYGAYCVLYYKGDWFNEPDFSMNELEMRLSICQKKSSNPLVHEGIRVIIYSLAKKVSASMKK